jgi:hypothetical protein
MALGLYLCAIMHDHARSCASLRKVAQVCASVIDILKAFPCILLIPLPTLFRNSYRLQGLELGLSIYFL